MSNTKSPGSAGDNDVDVAPDVDVTPDDPNRQDVEPTQPVDPDSNADRTGSATNDTADADNADGENSDSAAVVDEVVPTTAFGGMQLVAVIGAVVLVLDQITKIWAASALVDRDIDLFWTARFNLTRNYGSAFGLGTELGRWLGVLIVGVVIALLLYARKITDRRMLALFGLIAGGAIGNLIDRVVRAKDGFMSGGVIDFIDFQWWPIFNIADIAVVCGAIGLMALSLREPDAGTAA